jgi:serine/threonine-protein phosphatase 5
MCDLLWADPISEPGRRPSKRGVSMGFGSDISSKFLDQNKLGMCFL